MAKKSIIAREHKRERMVAKYADLRKKLKAEGNWEELDKLPRNSNKIRLHNRCKLTGRPKGYMRDFGVNRVMFRKMANEGKIPGITKSSW
ncbi:MAG: 30S ribosomal protein S14 [Saprospiraceae bacterium]|jgi:small subunit ribosomal protein S14|nr:30S ribosomal protein S14 [Saprospiraceae bacterium]